MVSSIRQQPLACHHKAKKHQRQQGRKLKRRTNNLHDKRQHTKTHATQISRTRKSIGSRSGITHELASNISEINEHRQAHRTQRTQHKQDARDNEQGSGAHRDHGRQQHTHQSVHHHNVAPEQENHVHHTKNRKHAVAARNHPASLTQRITTPIQARRNHSHTKAHHGGKHRKTARMHKHSGEQNSELIPQAVANNTAQITAGSTRHHQPHRGNISDRNTQQHQTASHIGHHHTRDTQGGCGRCRCGGGSGCRRRIQRRNRSGARCRRGISRCRRGISRCDRLIS